MTAVDRFAVDRFADGYVPHFDIDAQVGAQGQLFVADLLEALASARGEVKTDEQAARTGNVFIEYECLRRGKYRPSGISVTEAAIWYHVLTGPTLIAAPTERVKAVARAFYERGKTADGGLSGSHPTRGVLIPVTAFVHQLIKQSQTSAGAVERQDRTAPVPAESSPEDGAT